MVLKAQTFYARVVETFPLQLGGLGKMAGAYPVGFLSQSSQMEMSY